MSTLVISGQRDSIIPEALIRKAVQKMPNAQYFMLNSNHFEFCESDVFEKNIALQLEFLKENVPTHSIAAVA